MAKKPTASLEKVFEVMAKHDFNVKAASQELQINKSRIYNIKSKNKNEWHALMQKHRKEQGDVEGQKRYTGVKKVADHKIDRSQRSVKSDMHEKFVGKRFPIADDNPENVQQLKSAKEQRETDKPANVQRSVTGESYKEENARLVQQNKELGEALSRANERLEEVTGKHNDLADELKAKVRDIIALESDKKHLQGRLDEKSQEFLELKNRHESYKIASLDKFKEMNKEYNDLLSDKGDSSNDNSDVIYADNYVVKLGKVYVEDSHELTEEPNPLEIAVAKDVAEFSGGKIYQTALMPYKG